VILPLAALAILSVLFLLGRKPDPDDAHPLCRCRPAEDMAATPA
jgi:lipopolysaccharide export system protein LptC